MASAVRTDSVDGRPLRGPLVRARGFTLIEVLVVLALFAAVAAVVVSVGAWRIGRASLEESVRQVESAVVSARARSLRDGVVILVQAESDAEGVWRIFGEPQSNESDAPAGTRIVLVELPRGMRFEPAPDPDSQGESRLGVKGADEPTRSVFVLAVCLPDGRVEPALPLPSITGDEGALGLVIDRWSGAVTARANVPHADGAEVTHSARVETDTVAEAAQPSPGEVSP